MLGSFYFAKNSFIQITCINIFKKNVIFSWQKEEVNFMSKPG
ncbi:hypothetical protein G3A_06070 [Bacillus sp. 17376]|nr:hypothetical protein G3A_06070 [Bacillus sp. 17376]